MNNLKYVTNKNNAALRFPPNLPKSFVAAEKKRCKEDSSCY